MPKHTATPDQESRLARALRHSEGYSFTELDPGRFICETPAGNSYLTSAEGCSCPDAEFNLRGTDILCRHRIQLAHLLLAEGRDPAMEAAEIARQEEAARRLADLRAELKAERAAVERRQFEVEFARIFG